MYAVIYHATMLLALFRSEKVFREAAALVPDLGRLVKLDLVSLMPCRDSLYYE